MAIWLSKSNWSIEHLVLWEPPQWKWNLNSWKTICWGQMGEVEAKWSRRLFLSKEDGNHHLREGVDDFVARRDKFNWFFSFFYLFSSFPDPISTFFLVQSQPESCEGNKCKGQKETKTSFGLWNLSSNSIMTGSTPHQRSPHPTFAKRSRKIKSQNSSQESSKGNWFGCLFAGFWSSTL